MPLGPPPTRMFWVVCLNFGSASDRGVSASEVIIADGSFDALLGGELFPFWDGFSVGCDFILVTSLGVPQATTLPKRIATVMMLVTTLLTML
tara:strand:- start:2647 stop:2922 length:276 start_codon:yes stop_codon:yes gene_type:complete